ncbi:MAG: hypothetical protein L6R42_000084 [Xanthoria sp. 1 TBL-2021]|nr:MAG: hypothetical protein L6R42_000084 [Xanthoria sp. 1 TBL-2021]
MDITTILLDYGADATIPRKDEMTTLQHASYDGRLDLVKLLLDHTQQKLTPERFNAYLNHRNELGKTALYDSIRSATGHPELEVFRLLLDRGADYTIPKKHDVSPLHAAAYHGNVTVVSTLLSHSSKKDSPEDFQALINARNDEGKTPLHDACEKGRQRVTKLLMDFGADYTLADDNGRTALHWCVPRDQIKTMQVLLDEASSRDKNGGDNRSRSAIFRNFIDARTRTTFSTALCDASIKGSLEIVSLLLENDADDQLGDESNILPLEHAIAQNHTEVAIRLLDLSFVRVKNGQGRSEVFQGQERSEEWWGKIGPAKALAKEKGMDQVVEYIEAIQKSCFIDMGGSR